MKKTEREGDKNKNIFGRSGIYGQEKLRFIYG
jgi:hypothetical protein